MENNSQAILKRDIGFFVSNRSNMNVLSQTYIDSLLIYKSIVKANLSVKRIKEEGHQQVSSEEIEFKDGIAF